MHGARNQQLKRLVTESLVHIKCNVGQEEIFIQQFFEMSSDLICILNQNQLDQPQKESWTNHGPTT